MSHKNTTAHNEAVPPSPFSTRVYLGWITDLASQPDPHAAWPSLRRDAHLLADYERQLDAVAEMGFGAVCIWGLSVSRDWPLDLRAALSPEKREFTTVLADLARARGLKLLAGLGVYSWGFDALIAAHPHLARTNPHAMCPHVPESEDWMRRVTDFVLQELPVDGVQMQSADMDRCRCEQCLAWNDLQHHAYLNTQVAAYIRANCPDKVVGVNSWGMNFGQAVERQAALPTLIEMSHSIDYLTEVDNALGRAGGTVRRDFFAAMACDCGTLGGPQVEPPQHWKRSRWFLPVVRRRGEHVKALSEDGGRSCELFFHIDANAGDVLSLWVAGYALQHPQADWQSLLRRAVDRLYQPRTEAAAQTLCDIFTRAEAAFFDRVPHLTERTFSLEPLVHPDHSGCDSPGPPIYLRSLGREGCGAYAADLSALLPAIHSLRGQVENVALPDDIAACVQNAIADAQRAALEEE